jgi:UDP-N-acetylglucosamine 2-epimerase (non-hydrolysing)
VTHRDFNTDVPERVKEILEQFGGLTKRYKTIFPMHPRTAKRIREFKLDELLKEILVIEPVDYDGFGRKEQVCDNGLWWITERSLLVWKKATVVMPDTGWKEFVETDWNDLSEPNEIAEKSKYIDNHANPPENVYGESNASEKITEVILHWKKYLSSLFLWKESFWYSSSEAMRDEKNA